MRSTSGSTFSISICLPRRTSASRSRTIWFASRCRLRARSTARRTWRSCTAGARRSGEARPRRLTGAVPGAGRVRVEAARGVDIDLGDAELADLGARLPRPAPGSGCARSRAAASRSCRSWTYMPGCSRGDGDELDHLALESNLPTNYRDSRARSPATRDGARVRASSTTAAPSACVARPGPTQCRRRQAARIRGFRQICLQESRGAYRLSRPRRCARPRNLDRIRRAYRHPRAAPHHPRRAQLRHADEVPPRHPGAEEARPARHPGR